ncbi:hypothetical protein [Nocardia camponoti]|uniref:hypothetical protein n=1 Tax=Nocardia camponoti TaxID=1616106 RepID=UPI001E32E551|nr:hypothetical protein [Nocardia camponoti]
MRGLHREPRLARPARASQCREAITRDQLTHYRDIGFLADVTRQFSPQIRRPLLRSTTNFATQKRHMQVRQFRRRVDAKLVGQCFAGGLIHRKRLGPAPSGGECAHQRSDEPLANGVPRNQFR